MKKTPLTFQDWITVRENFDVADRPRGPHVNWNDIDTEDEGDFEDIHGDAADDAWDRKNEPFGIGSRSGQMTDPGLPRGMSELPGGKYQSHVRGEREADQPGDRYMKFKELEHKATLGPLSPAERFLLNSFYLRMGQPLKMVDPKEEIDLWNQKHGVV